MKRIVSFLLAVYLLLLSGCQIQPPTATTAPDAHGSVTVRRLSNYAIQDNIIYYVGPARDSLFAHDLRTGETSLVKRHFDISGFLHPDGDRMYYYTDATVKEGIAVHTLSLSDKSLQTSFSMSNGIGVARYDEGYYYYLGCAILEGGQKVIFSLYRTHLETRETTLVCEDLGDFTAFSIDDRYIYVTRKTEGGLHSVLLRSPKDTLAFEEIPLPFDPHTVYTTEDGMYIVPYNGNPVHYANGTTTELPLQIKGTKWYVIGRKIIYLDAATRTQVKIPGCHSLCSYDLDTKERTVLADSAMDIDVLENRYIVYQWMDQEHYVIQMYDMHTGQTHPICDEAGNFFAS